MILYLDASALVKRYVAERGTEAVNEVVSRATTVGTSLISRAEVAAAFAKSVRTRTLTSDRSHGGAPGFRDEWPHCYAYKSD